MIYLAAANAFPKTEIGESILNLLDRFINPGRLTGEFLYYEVGMDGKLTEFGQLLVLPNRILIDFSKLEKGMILESQSSVYVRPIPNTTEEYLETYNKGHCFRILEKTVELKQPRLGNARNGGWLKILEEECPSEIPS